MYENLTPFTMLSFEKDLREIINALHTYSRHRKPRSKLALELIEADEIKVLIPPFIDMTGSKRFFPDNPELYNGILNMLEEDIGKIDMGIPEDIIKGMQHIDLKKIYNELPALIGKEGCSTIRKLACDFPVFENDRLSLVAVFSGVLFLANEGKVSLMQMDDDIGVRILI
jgi:hypothetical protein